MRIQFKLSGLLLFAWVGSAVAQVGNPSVSSAAIFDQYPVSIETGLPRVNFPLYTMATHNKDLDINISLGYHQSSIRPAARRSGNCGRGWNLSANGSISSNGHSGYSFNFMGYSGGFKTERDANQQLIVNVSEKNGVKLHAVVHQEILQSPTGFTFIDGKGNRFEFNTIDIIDVSTSPSTSLPTNMSYQLTKIYDSNDNLLVNYLYDTVEEEVLIDKTNGIESYKYNQLKILREIQIVDYGKIVFSYSTLPDKDGLWLVYDAVVIKDNYDNEIKNISLGTALENGSGSTYNIFNVNLHSVTISGTGGILPESYLFYYKPHSQYNLFSTVTEGTDSYGYKNINDKYCNVPYVLSGVNKDVITEGILEKIVYPTGGSVVYNYESNSFFGGVATYLDPVGYPNNYNFNQLLSDITESFTISQPTVVYIKVYGNNSFAPGGIEDINNTNPSIAPIYRLVNAQNTNQQFGANILRTSNSENECLGRKMTLAPGSYKLLKGVGGTNPQVLIYTITQKDVIEKWTNAGGVRIKQIAYFTSNAPQNYFRPDAGQTFPFFAAKQEFYNYNIFGDQTVSSGNINPAVFGDPILYSNVTVTDGVSNGRTEYTFDILREGKMTNSKVYNANNILLQETSANYHDISVGNITVYLVKESVSKEYLGSTVEKKDTFEYDTNRKIKTKTSTSSRSRDGKITNFYYHLDANNNAYSVNRFGEIDRIEEFLGSTPLSKTQMSYNNSWQNTQGSTVSNSYYASTIAKSKGNATPEVQIKNNIYDKYGNILETEDAGGLKKCYVLGYNDTVVIAEIIGVAYASLPVTLVNAAKTASNSNNETALLAALFNLRNSTALSAANITTYTYKPLNGISTVTDARGYLMKTEYDATGRQIAVKDQDGNIITDTVYHNKFQN